MIRLATLADIPRIVEMGLRFRESSDYKNHIVANTEQITKLSELVIAQEGCLLSERDGKVCGMIAVYLFPHFISGELIAGEVVWWVEPEYRGEGIKLVREAERRARAKGAVKMQMIAPTEQVARIYERIGYDYIESAYQRDLTKAKCPQATDDGENIYDLAWSVGRMNNDEVIS
jgi:GNAT superfamily N-acetyltransferase